MAEVEPTLEWRDQSNRLVEAYVAKNDRYSARIWRRLVDQTAGWRYVVYDYEAQGFVDNDESQDIEEAAGRCAAAMTIGVSHEAL